MTFRQISALLLLSALWGGSFLFMRIAAPALGPILLIFLRVGLAGLALLAYGAATHTLPRLGGRWRQYLVIGAINSALPFSLIAFASLSLPASMTATLNATTPLFGAVVAALWLRERLTLRRVLGLLLGVGGVATLMGLGPVAWAPATVLATAASLLAAVSYGVAAVYTKARAQGAPSGAVATYSQVFAALVLLPVTPFALPGRAPSALVAGCVVALALLCTALGYLLYFYLILNAGPTRATLVTILSPAFGMLWGAMLLKEPLGIGSFAGFALILASVALLSASSRRKEEPHGKRGALESGARA